MLIHLACSIKRFGPPALYATQTEESYNGVMRKSSVHSNRQSPGRDIATNFNNYNLARLLLSGGLFHDSHLNILTKAGPGVLKYFEKKTIQKGLGWNSTWNTKALARPVSKFMPHLPWTSHTHSLTPCFDWFRKKWQCSPPSFRHCRTMAPGKLLQPQEVQHS